MIIADFLYNYKCFSDVIQNCVNMSVKKTQGILLNEEDQSMLFDLPLDELKKFKPDREEPKILINFGERPFRSYEKF